MIVIEAKDEQLNIVRSRGTWKGVSYFYVRLSTCDMMDARCFKGVLAL